MVATLHQEFEARLDALVQERFGSGAFLSGLTRLAGGVSNIIWSFDLQHPGAGHEPQPMVLRMDMAHPLFPGGRAAEGELLDYIHGRGMPVPRVYWIEHDPAVLGGSFFVMERIAGESLINPLQQQPRYAQAREAIVPQLGRALAQIQQITAADPLPPRVELLRRGAQASLDFHDESYRRVALDAHPVIELALRWLQAHLPPERPLVLSHGDYRIQNMMYDETGLRAVLDWELAHFGDPMEDVAWVALRSWRGSRDELDIGGVGTREAFMAAYTGAGGETVPPEEARFWDIYANWVWAIVTINQAHSFLSGEPNIELANLGRRTAEMEWDLLRLLEAAG